jgi:hypothetical protein
VFTLRNQSDQYYITAGYNCFLLGATSFDCPYGKGDYRLKLWLDGYALAKRKVGKRPRFVTFLK